MALGNETNCVRQEGPNDSSTNISALLLKAAMIASAGYNTAAAIKIASDQWDLAKRYWKIALGWLDYYRGYYAPVEDQEVQEALKLEVAQPDYETARGRTRVNAWLEFRGALNKAQRCLSRYCTGLREDMLLDLVSAQADAVALADGLGYRNERAYIEARNEVRFEKMLNTAKRGRDMVADNVSLTKATAGIYGDAYDQAWQGLRGVGYFLGYENSRNPTYYPTTYLSGNIRNRGIIASIGDAWSPSSGIAERGGGSTVSMFAGDSWSPSSGIAQRGGEATVSMYNE